VLLSGGIDSAVALYIARQRGFCCSCLIFDYSQRHRREIASARMIARRASCHYETVKLNFPHKASGLLDRQILIAERPKRSKKDSTIPLTYVPARNIIFLSFALSWAEAIGACAIFIGAHTQDYSGYPDCRPEFIRAFGRAAYHGTKAGAEGRKIKIVAPLLNKNKAEIIRWGRRLGVPFELTWSCYRGKDRPCMACDSCYFRAKGFKASGIEDPALW
jgi:7-cyano-7-deazaguanine synthase